MSMNTFLNFRMEAYSAADGSWITRELAEDNGDLFTPLVPLPLPVMVPLMVPFPLPFNLPPWEEKQTHDNTRFFNWLTSLTPPPRSFLTDTVWFWQCDCVWLTIKFHFKNPMCVFNMSMYVRSRSHFHHELRSHELTGCELLWLWLECWQMWLQEQREKSCATHHTCLYVSVLVVCAHAYTVRHPDNYSVWHWKPGATSLLEQHPTSL